MSIDTATRDNLPVRVMLDTYEDTSYENASCDLALADAGEAAAEYGSVIEEGD